MHRFRKLHVAHAEFCVETYKRFGAFLNKKFWEINVAWGESQDLHENVAELQKYLQGRQL